MTIPEGHRHQTHASLKQVLTYGIRLKMLEENPASAIKNPAPKPTEFQAFASWDEVYAIATSSASTGRSRSSRRAPDCGPRSGSRWIGRTSTSGSAPSRCSGRTPLAG